MLASLLCGSQSGGSGHAAVNLEVLRLSCTTSAGHSAANSASLKSVHMISTPSRLLFVFAQSMGRFPTLLSPHRFTILSHLSNAFRLSARNCRLFTLTNRFSSSDISGLTCLRRASGFSHCASTAARSATQLAFWSIRTLALFFFGSISPFLFPSFSHIVSIG